MSSEPRYSAYYRTIMKNKELKEQGKKWCRACKQGKDLSEFYAYMSVKVGPNLCKTCSSKASKLYRTNKGNKKCPTK